MTSDSLHICLLSIHSSPFGEIGTKDTGGMSVYLREIASELGILGHRVDLVTLAEFGEETTCLEVDDATRLVCLANISAEKPTKETLIHQLPEIASTFLEFIRQERVFYALIHSHYWLSGRLAEFICKEMPIRHIVTYHTLGAVKNRACGKNGEPEWRIEQEKILAQRCRSIICFTEAEQKDLVTLYSADIRKIDIVPCGVNQQLFQPVVQAKETQERLLPARRETALLFVGRFVHIKGLDVLLQAMSLLSYSQCDLYLVGGDDGKSLEYERVKTTVEKYGLEGRVHFMGRVEHSELPSYYSAADGVIVPSLHESFGLVALESLSCGTPVIGSSVGGMVSILKSGAGATVLPGDVESLAEIIEKMFIKKNIPLMSSRSIRQSIEHLSWLNSAEKLVEIYTAE